MQQYILQENVLTDNTLLLADEGKYFKGNYIAIVKEYQFQSAWTDKLNVRKFRSHNQLNKFLKKEYPKFQF